jgi:hypothetical protein
VCVEQEISRLDGLYSGLCADRHENRSLNIAMSKMQNTAPCLRTDIAGDYVELAYVAFFQNAADYIIYGNTGQ